MRSNYFSLAAIKQNKADAGITIGLIAVIVFFVVTAILSYLNVQSLNDNNQKLVHTQQVLAALDGLLSYMQDAETGQRGYIITGSDKYLAPYAGALLHIEQQVNKVDMLTRSNLSQQARIVPLKVHIAAKLAELNSTIELRKKSGVDAAVAVVLTDRGRMEMDAIRAHIDDMQQDEWSLRKQRLAEMGSAYQIAVFSGIFTGILGLVLSVTVAVLVRRNAFQRRKQDWLKSGQLGLAEAMSGEQPVEKLGENILKFLARYFGSQAGILFVEDGGSYRRVAAYGVPSDAKIVDRFARGDGLLGQAVSDARAFELHDIPDGYLLVSSGLGRDKPRHLVIAPATSNHVVNAVVELGSIQPFADDALDLLELVSEPMSIAIRSASYRAHLQNLLEETQRQSEELQAQSEELRVSNEELEEQSRALKDSQARMEQQQTELEQTNSQLEEQAQLLEAQKDDLQRSSALVQTKASELEQASRYKSDFLANMSHELRTPLNSALILAKLLADNSAGNLTVEQVKFAKTIQSSGNDLLTLINDVLDLSKIEAGHMEIRAEPVSLARLLESLGRSFDHVARQKQITFRTSIAAACPDVIESDRQRLEQVLRNLLSNAIKFTEHGSVELMVGKATDGRVAFAVIDSGIGISSDQQRMIFEAFRQADSTINRKYGGTGLGLSISRELVRLLGGSIDLKSESGKGSTFTVSIPENYDAAQVQTQRSETAEAAEAMPMAKPVSAHQPNTASYMRDDRDALINNRRVILVIEDDKTFARILYDLAHELDFQCLIAATTDDALDVARRYLPNAVILDIGLPDHSGLLVLDQLKRDMKTRHIPVHVVSASDYTQTALAMGAVGYALKPVKREELAAVLRQFENRLSQDLRRVLIVEDDQVQRDSVMKLLEKQNVEMVGVSTAAECLAQLQQSTFDCMVLDLTLPDATGYSLLATLSESDAHSFPPVIVYTARDLSADEELKLRRYSKSIIIKGAKSPERLLDEVTLFLHQVVSELPPDQQSMLQMAQHRGAALHGKRILIVEDDIRNVYALTNILEPQGAIIEIARNGREAISKLEKSTGASSDGIDLVLMDVMMPEMDGISATREIRKRAEWKKLPIIMLTAKAMRDDQERCLDAGANDYMAKPVDVEKLLSLVRIWMPR